MKPFSAIVLLLLGLAVLTARAQEEQGWVVQALNRVLPGTIKGEVSFDYAKGLATGTNGILVQNGNTTLTADSASLNMQTGDVEADGNVRIESNGALWVGEHVHYNFKTSQMRTEQFRTGRLPVFAGGEALTGNTSNQVFEVKNGFITTDDVFDPIYTIRANRVRFVPGKSVEMWNAVVYTAKIPMFYFPYYKRNLGLRANNLLAVPGYNSRYGGYLLTTYRWYLGDQVDGRLHMDYRAKRGLGVGPDVSGDLGEWGKFDLKYYYTHDERPNYSTNSAGKPRPPPT
jgi:LPS-assembly protein